MSQRIAEPSAITLRDVAILVASTVAAGFGVALLADGLRFPSPDPTGVVDAAVYHGVGVGSQRALAAVAAVAWPVLVLAAALALQGLWRPGTGRWNRPLLSARSPARGAYDALAGGTDASVLGAAAGLGMALAFGYGVAAAAGIALAVAAGLLLATGREPDRLARAVAALAPAGPALLAVASARTAVHVVESGSIQPYPWFPGWLAAVLAGAGWAAALRFGPERAARPLAMLWVGLPLAWLLAARLPGAVGPLDLLHDGERLNGALAALAGRWPWTDLAVIGGGWDDAGRALAGMLVFEPTIWGAQAGVELLLRPLWLLGTAALFAWLSGWRWPHAALATLLAALLAPAADGRLLLWAPTLAAFALLLVRATPWRALAVVVLAACQILLVPAAATGALAIATVLVLREACAGDERGLRRYRRTGWFAAWVLLAGAGAAAVLVAGGGRDMLWPLTLGFDAAGFVDRRAGGGLPLHAVAPVVAGSIVVALAVVAAGAGWCWLRRGRPGARDWVVIAAGLFAMTALPGIVAGDPVGLPQAAAVPVGAVAMRLLAAIETAMPRGRLVLHPAMTTGLLLALAGVAMRPGDSPTIDPEDMARRLRPTVVAGGTERLLGYARAGAVDPAVFDGWRLLLDGWVAPGGTVLDLSGRPTLFAVLLGYRPLGRFLHGNLATGPEDQEGLAALLDRPGAGAVVLPTEVGDDGIPATVRQHRLVRAILDRYVPVEAFPDGVLYVPRGTDLADPALHARVVACDWGRAATAAVAGPPDREPVEWPAAPVSGPETVVLRGSLDAAGEGASPVELVVALLDGRPIADEVPVPGPDGGAQRFQITVQTSRGAGQRVRLAASLADGGVRPIVAGPGIGVDGTPEQVGPPAGRIEARDITVHDGVLRLLPPPTDPAIRAALRLVVVSGAEPGRRYRLADRPPWSRDGSGAAIRFAAAGAGRTVVPVGACPQWRGYRAGPLYLWSEDGAATDALSLAWETGPGDGRR